MNQRQFSLSIANTSGDTKVIALNPAYFDTLAIVIGAAVTEGAATTKMRSDATQIAAAGYTCDGVIDDGTIISGVTCTASNARFKIRDFLQYIRLNPTRIKKITIACANTDAYEKTITVTVVNPTGNQGDEYINLTNYFATQQYNEDKIVVPFEGDGAAFNDETLWTMPIDTARTVTITFHF